MRRIFLILAFIAAFSSPAFADLAAGKKAYDGKDWAAAILNLRPLAEAGDAKAMVLLANMYSNGYGVAQDHKEAFGLYRNAAVYGDPAGMIATATLYQQGIGVPVNTRLAITWFERAARIGSATGAFFYAIHLYQGSKGENFDFKPDLPAAYRWFKISSQSPSAAEGLRKSASQIVGILAVKLSPEEVTAADAAVADWKPEDPATLGPPPEAQAEDKN